jgi:NitT/TauT family transport system substrate-binding protein
MPEGAPQNVLSVLSRVNPEISARHVDLSRTYTDRFVASAPVGASDSANAKSH